MRCSSLTCRTVHAHRRGTGCAAPASCPAVPLGLREPVYRCCPLLLLWAPPPSTPTHSFTIPLPAPRFALQLLSQHDLDPTGKMRIAAMRSGYLTPPPKELVRAPRKQVRHAAGPLQLGGWLACRRGGPACVDAGALPALPFSLLFPRCLLSYAIYRLHS